MTNVYKVATQALAIAVRDRLRSVLNLSANDCNIEHDEIAHPISGDKYLAVMSRGFMPGPRHGSSGGIKDLLFTVEVMAVRRITHVPRDRTRDAYLLNSGSLEELIGDVFNVVDWREEIRNTANQTILTDTGYANAFNHPLVFGSMNQQPQVVGAEMFAGRDESRAGLKKSIVFSHARFTIVP